MARMGAAKSIQKFDGKIALKENICKLRVRGVDNSEIYLREMVLEADGLARDRVS
jgi:hypothetical protein